MDSDCELSLVHILEYPSREFGSALCQASMCVKKCMTYPSWKVLSVRNMLVGLRMEWIDSSFVP